jgi:GT2 family glycosyltransferase
MKSVCLAILNYNGRKHLEHLLPTACVAAENYPGACSVLVLDNRSTEPDVEWIRQQYPSVRVVIAPENDFLFSYNWLMPQLNEEIVVLLNNDLRLHAHFLEPLVWHFQSGDVFAVSASSYDWEGTRRTSGPARLTFRNGFYGWLYEPERQEVCHTLFVSGGFSAVDRQKFMELGGFNRLFHPAYCEDLDLSFRAWRKGWRSIYEPASIVWHREHASWEVSTAAKPNRLYLRHGLLFQWSSLPMERERRKRYWSMFKLCLGGLLGGDTVWLSLYPRVWWEWRQIKKHYSGLRVSRPELVTMEKAMTVPLKSAANESAHIAL